MRHRQKMLILTAVLLAMFLGAIDQTIVSAAAPGIVADLHGMDRFTWITTAYLMTSTAMVPIFGKLADLYSRKSVIIGAVSVFLLGSCLCGLAGLFGFLPIFGDGMNQLVISRAIQGLGGAGLFALTFVVIADLFTPAERARYQGYTGAVFATASILGPMLGGFMADQGGVLAPVIAGWRLVFFINLPFGLVALLMIIRQMPSFIQASRGDTNRLDWPSTALLLSGVGTLVVAIQIFKGATATATVVMLFVTGVALLFIFVLRSLRISNPVLNFGLFKNKVFRPASVAIFLLGAAFLGIIIFEPLFMVKVLRKSATEAGLGLIPFSLGVVCTSTLSGRMVSRYGHYKHWMLAGLVLLIAGLLLLILDPRNPSFQWLLLRIALCGLGIGPSMPLYTLAIQNATERHLIGQATSACQFLRQIGGVIASAVLGVVLTASLSGSPAKSAEAYIAAIGHVHELILLLVVVALAVTLHVPEMPLARTRALN